MQVRLLAPARLSDRCPQNFPSKEAQYHNLSSIIYHHNTNFDKHFCHYIILKMPLSVPQGHSQHGSSTSLFETAPSFHNFISQEVKTFMQVPTIKRQKLDENNGSMKTGAPKTTSTRRKVSGMTSEERLQWARLQSAQHSKKTRERHKTMEKVTPSFYPQICIQWMTSLMLTWFSLSSWYTMCTS